jgi:hypothetical protein
MKRFLLAFATVATLLVGILLPVNFAQAENSSPLVTCVNLSTKTERISRTGKCRITQEAQANWHVLSTDSRLPEKGKSKLISICSNKTTSPVTYQIIRAKCASHQIRTDYFRSNLLNASPTITKVVAMGYDSAQVSVAHDSNANPDAPVAYYTITSDKGQSKNIYTWGETNLTIDNLAELTTYSFTVTVTTADGTSSISASSNSVTTNKYVAPPAQTSSSAQTISAPVAQVTLLSSDTASVTIPAGATSFAVSAPTLGNPSLSFGSQSAAISATISSAANPAGGSSTPFIVSGSTKIVDIAVSGLSGSATVCLDASPTAKLWHYIGGAWVDITSSRTSTQVCGLTSSFSPFTGEDQLPAPAFALSSSSENRTFNTAITGYTISSTGGAISSYSISPTAPAGLTFSTSTGLLSGSPSSIASATAYTITATNATGSASRTFTLTVNIGIYTVGQRGPGGGIVFYVSAAPFTSTGSTCNTDCKYLEVAPATWQSGGGTVQNDTQMQWSTNNGLTGQDMSTAGTESLFTDEKFNWKIGQGFYNTSVMKVSGATSTAQAAVLAYAGNSTAGQWFIPSMNELNELCKYARGQTTGVLTVKCNFEGTLKTGTVNDLGGFGILGDYWSSTEKESAQARYQFIGDHSTSGLQLSTWKTASGAFVRPIRAF